jgi:hypothetical protein
MRLHWCQARPTVAARVLSFDRCQCRDARAIVEGLFLHNIIIGYYYFYYYYYYYYYYYCWYSNNEKSLSLDTHRMSLRMMGLWNHVGGRS